jgi:hypothetical protein
MTGSGTVTGTPSRGVFGVKLQMLYWGHFMCPFEVAGLGGRYLVTVWVER